MSTTTSSGPCDHDDIEDAAAIADEADEDRQDSGR